MKSGVPGRDGLVFVNNSSETFTPSVSGAIATFIFECCLAAQCVGDEPLVVTQPSDATPYNWPNTVFVERPAPRGTGSIIERGLRKTVGLPWLGALGWAIAVAAAVRRRFGREAVLILHNDPELVVLLRILLPASTLVHVFHNQLPRRGLLGRFVRRSVDRVVAVSSYTGQCVSAEFGIGRDAIDVVHGGVNVSTFSPPVKREGVPVIGFLGRTGIEKGPDVFLRALIRLSDRTTDFSAQVVGSNHWGRFEDDEYQRELSELISELERNGIAVERPGHVVRAEIPSWLERSWIHVVPSRWEEPCALTLMEGMATGNIVVASATGGTPEVVRDAGQLFERNDDIGLANQLEMLLQDPDSMEQWATRSRKRAEELSWSRTYDRLVRISIGDVVRSVGASFNGAP